jgi:hypothetical protein
MYLEYQMGDAPGRWLLLIHQLPPKPDYFRVKIWRRLQRIGAVTIKSSVYALPATEPAREDFQWLLREITAGGGDASVCEARFVEGLSDEQLEALFNAARDADYHQLAEDARHALEQPSENPGADRSRDALAAELTRLRRRFTEIVAIDFCNAPGREVAAGLLTGLEARLRAAEEERPAGALRPEEYRGRVWVTRRGVHIDRMASAWLIRRFLDPEARFRFVDPKAYRHSKGELRFDMYEAEFTHEGDRCSFEVLRDRFGLKAPALAAIAEIIHDIDLKEPRYQRPETAGVDHLILGIAMGHKEDEARLARSAALFDDLCTYFQKKAG